MLRQAMKEAGGAGLDAKGDEGDTLGILAEPVGGGEVGTDVSSSVLEHTISRDSALADVDDENVRARHIESNQVAAWVTLRLAFLREKFAVGKEDTARSELHSTAVSRGVHFTIAVLERIPNTLCQWDSC